MRFPSYCYCTFSQLVNTGRKNIPCRHVLFQLKRPVDGEPDSRCNHQCGSGLQGDVVTFVAVVTDLRHDGNTARDEYVVSGGRNASRVPVGRIFPRIAGGACPYPEGPRHRHKDVSRQGICGWACAYLYDRPVIPCSRIGGDLRIRGQSRRAGNDRVVSPVVGPLPVHHGADVTDEAHCAGTLPQDDGRVAGNAPARRSRVDACDFDNAVGTTVVVGDPEFDIIVPGGIEKMDRVLERRSASIPVVPLPCGDKSPAVRLRQVEEKGRLVEAVSRLHKVGQRLWPYINV